MIEIETGNRAEINVHTVYGIKRTSHNHNIYIWYNSTATLIFTVVYPFRVAVSFVRVRAESSGTESKREISVCIFVYVSYVASVNCECARVCIFGAYSNRWYLVVYKQKSQLPRSTTIHTAFDQLHYRLRD